MGFCFDFQGRVFGPVDNGAPLFCIAGPCALESRAHALEVSAALTEIFAAAGVPFIYKSSFDKANRSSGASFRGVGMTEAVLGQVDKRAALCGIMERCGVVAEEVAFIGDDIPDMEVFDLCGLSVTVGDAPDYMKARADLVLECEGGMGAFREMVDRILEKKAGVGVLPEKEAS